MQALASGLRRLHRFQNKKEPVSETGPKRGNQIQPQEKSDQRRRKKNFQRICRRKSNGRRSHSKPPGLRPFGFARGSIGSLLEKALAQLNQLPKSAGGREWKVCFTHQGKWASALLCAIRKGAVATARAQKKIRYEASRKQKQASEEALKLAAFIMVFTTVSQKVVSTSEVLELYRVRWQIELRFKHLKSLLGLGCLPKYDAQSCRAWIQAKLLCGLLIERLMREAKFFFPWGYRLPAAEPLAGIH